MFLNKPHGWLEVICGSMFSGKTEELIRRIRQSEYGRLKVKVFKPAIDNRYSNHSIDSHNGSSFAAQSVNNSEEILSIVEEDVNVVGIDEVQFFDEKIVHVVDQLANQGRRVIVAGLDTNFRGEPFGCMPTLMALSDSITKLNAICTICSAPASRTQRLIHGKPAAYDEPVILVGAAESYEPRCRLHHEVPHKLSSEVKKSIE